MAAATKAGGPRCTCMQTKQNIVCGNFTIIIVVVAEAVVEVVGGRRCLLDTVACGAARNEL